MNQPKYYGVHPPDGAAREIWVEGYPRSGTTWLARLLGSALVCPVHSANTRPDQNDRVCEGWGRKSDLLVRRWHDSIREINAVPEVPWGNVVMIARDPRDVAVSCWHYFTYPKTPEGLERCVRQVCGLEAGKPLYPYGAWGSPENPGWAGYIEGFLDEGAYIVRYIDLLLATYTTVWGIYRHLGLTGRFHRPTVLEAIERNTFANTPNDQGTRRGIAGAYRDELPLDLQQLIVSECGSVMARCGFALE